MAVLILFTSGGSESNNMAVTGTALANQRAGKHIISTAIEHPSVYNPMAFLEEQGFEITFLPVDGEGHISLEELAQGKGEPGEPAEALTEPMLVFCGLGQALLEQVLEVIRLAKLPPIPLKAVLTETNREWDTTQLLAELVKEREAIAEAERK